MKAAIENRRPTLTQEEANTFGRIAKVSEEEAQAIHEGVLERCKMDEWPEFGATDWAEVITSDEDEDGRL